MRNLDLSKRQQFRAVAAPKRDPKRFTYACTPSEYAAYLRANADWWTRQHSTDPRYLRTFAYLRTEKAR